MQVAIPEENEQLVAVAAVQTKIAQRKIIKTKTSSSEPKMEERSTKPTFDNHNQLCCSKLLRTIGEAKR